MWMSEVNINYKRMFEAFPAEWIMDYLRGKIKSKTPSSEDYSSESWRNKSILRRRDDIYNTAYSRINSSTSRTTGILSSRYRSPLASYGNDSPYSARKYSSSFSPSPLNSPALVRTRKSSAYEGLAKHDINNDESARQDDKHEKSAEQEQINYKELYEKEKKEKEVCIQISTLMSVNK